MTQYEAHLSTCVDFYPDEFMPVMRAVQHYIDTFPCEKDAIVLDPFLDNLKELALQYAH